MIIRFPRHSEYVPDLLVFVPGVGLLVFDQVFVDEYIRLRVRELAGAGAMVKRR